jgi:hypothetical protein
MSALSPRATRAAGLAAGFAGLLLGLLAATGPERAARAAGRDGQPKDEYKAGLKAPDGKLELVGAAVCQKCHQENDPTKVKEYKETRGYDFIRLWENKVWDVHDLHRTAYLNLLTSRSAKAADGEKANATAQRMEDNLRRAGIDPKYKQANYTVAGDVNCLACHASTNEPATKESHKKWTADSFLTSDGVGCEMCHGHGSKYRDEHQKNKLDKANAPDGAIRVVPWREWSVDVKRDWGLVNLRDAAEATNRCASCHIGNLDEGRFVTHDMYAAGHPPLPPLDLIAYTREQPRHWGLPSEMPYLKNLAEKDPKKANAVFHIRADESHVARRFVESTVATLHSSAVVTGQLAADGKDEGLDYAAFDCASCHHNLKYPSDRQDRGYSARPGRPLFRPATFALTRVVMEHAAEMPGGGDLKASLEALATVEKNLAVAFTSKSLGDPAKVQAASAEMSKWSADALKKLSAVKYTNDETKKLLAKVQAATQKPVADPEVAQLYTWAFETLVLDQTPPAADKKPPAALEELHKKLKDVVVSRLRPNAAFYYEQGATGGVPGPTVEPVDTRISKRMDLFNSFQSAPFRKAFGEVKPFGK